MIAFMGLAQIPGAHVRSPSSLRCVYSLAGAYRAVLYKQKMKMKMKDCKSILCF